MDKILSIIIPTYNMEKYLHRCLKSLIITDERLFKRLDVLVVNDGSKDSSSQIAHEYEDIYPDVFRVIDKENGNYGSCVNIGLKEAKGKYIKILDADDFFNNDALQRYVGVLQTVESDIIVTDFSIVDDNSNLIRTQTFHFPSEQILKVDNYCDNSEFLDPVGMHAITYRTSILKEMGYVQTEGVSYTDQEWVFMPMIYTNMMVYYPLNLYQYLVGREGQTIDLKVASKQADTIKDLIMKRLYYYNSVKPHVDYAKKTLLKNKLMLNIMNFLHVGILNGLYDENVLMAFDKELKNADSELYILSENVPSATIHHFNYVKAWRTGSIFIPLLRVALRIKNTYLSR